MRSIYSRRPTSMPTWASADRTVQRGCEPSAINPLQGEKRERGRFLVARDIGTKRDLFNKDRTCPLPIRAIFATKLECMLRVSSVLPAADFVTLVRQSTNCQNSPAGAAMKRPIEALSV